MVHYEYLILIRTYSTNWSEIQVMKQQGSNPIPKQKDTNTWYIWWPGKENADIRSGEKDNLLTISNELGKDGWKLIDKSIVMSTILGECYGWEEVSMPIETQFIFIKEVHK